MLALWLYFAVGHYTLLADTALPPLADTSSDTLQNNADSSTDRADTGAADSLKSQADDQLTKATSDLTAARAMHSVSTDAQKAVQHALSDVELLSALQTASSKCPIKGAAGETWLGEKRQPSWERQQMLSSLMRDAKAENRVALREVSNSAV